VPSAARGSIRLMTAARNDPCPCGSGKKFKRCCAARTRDRMVEARREERVGREAEEWAFDQFGDELVTAGGQLTAQLAGSSQATWITEHWVMLDYELRSGGTAASRYAELPSLPSSDRAIAARIAGSRPGVHRVLSSRPGDGIDLLDLVRGGALTVISPSVSRQASAGDILVARIMDGSTPSLWGPAGVFKPQRAAILFDEVTALAGQNCERALRHAWPMLMTCDIPSPRLIARIGWDLDDPESVLGLLPATLEHDGCQDGADVFLWRIGPRPDDYGGFFELYRDGLVAWTYSDTLADDAITAIDRALGPLVTLAERESVPLAPDRRRRAA